MAPELQLLVSQLSSSLELGLRRLTFELWKLLRLETEPFTVCEDPCRLETEPFRLETDPDPCSVGEERLDGERGGGPSSFCRPEKTGHEAVDEHEPRSCLLDVILAFGCLFVPLTVTPRPVFEEPLCIFA